METARFERARRQSVHSVSDRNDSDAVRLARIMADCDARYEELKRSTAVFRNTTTRLNEVFHENLANTLESLNRILAEQKARTERSLRTHRHFMEKLDALERELGHA